MTTSSKAGFAQIFSCCPKNLSCPKFGGAAAPLAPPARTPMCIKVPEKSPFSESCGSRSTNLPYKSLTCHDSCHKGFFYLKNKISFVEETIGNISGENISLNMQ